MTVDGPPSSPSTPPAAAARYICTHLVATDGQADRVEAHLRAIGLRAFRSVQRSHALPSEMEISSSVNFSTTTPRSRGGKGEEEDTVEDTVGRCSYHRVSFDRCSSMVISDRDRVRLKHLHLSSINQRARKKATASGITNHLLLICPISSSDDSSQAAATVPYPYPGTASSLLSTLSPYSPAPPHTQQQHQRGPTVAFDAHAYLLRQISLRLLSPPSSSSSSCAPSISYSTTFLHQGADVARLLQRWARDLLMNKGEVPAPFPSSGVYYSAALRLDGIGLSAAQAQREVEALLRETEAEAGLDSRAGAGAGAGADSAYAQRKAEEERDREREKSERLAMTSLRRNWHPLAPLPPPTVLVPRKPNATDSARSPSAGDGAPESKQHGASAKYGKDNGKDAAAAAARTSGPGAHHRLFFSSKSSTSSSSSSARSHALAHAHGKPRRWNAALPPLLRLASGSLAAPPARESRSRQIQALCEALGLEHDLVCAPVASPSPSASPSSHAKPASVSARTSRAGGKREEDEGEAPSTDGYTLKDTDADPKDREQEKEKLAHALLGDLGKLGAKLLTVGSGADKHKRAGSSSAAGGKTGARNPRSRKEREKEKARQHKVTVAAAVAALALRGAACGPIGAVGAVGGGGARARARARAGRRGRGEEAEEGESFLSARKQAARALRLYQKQLLIAQEERDGTTSSTSASASSASSSSASDKASSAASAEAAAVAAQSPTAESPLLPEELEAQWEELEEELTLRLEPCRGLAQVLRAAECEVRRETWEAAERQAQADEQQALAEAEEEEEESKRRKRRAGALLGARGWRRARL